MERFEHFAFEEVPEEEGQQLDVNTRYIAILSVLVGCQGVQCLQRNADKSIGGRRVTCGSEGDCLSTVDYIGMGRMWDFLKVTNEIFLERGIALPLAGQATTTLQDRLEKGVDTQAKIFGDHMKEAWKMGHINRWLAANCFGDYYTRTGLTLAPAGADYLLLSYGAGRLRAAADRACERKPLIWAMIKSS